MMPITGIKVEKKDKYILCFIEDLTEDFKNIIRDNLQAICHGKKDIGLKMYSYKNTLSDFLIRYKNKDQKTKKGMMGEFIAHLVIDKFLPNLQKITILLNKEDISIRKGFDLTYVETDKGIIWYGEVKSGEVGSRENPDSKNTTLLHNSKSGIKEFLTGNRPHLWSSIITDVNLTLSQSKQKKVKELLDEDLQQIENNEEKKSVILVSVLFHDTQNKISIESIEDCLSKITSENIFSDVILFSIQKSTYSKIEKFLQEESSTN